MRRPLPVELSREIVPLPSDRRHQAADLLGLASADHPLVPFLAPTAHGRTRQALAVAGQSLIGFGEACGAVDVTSPILDGLAIWLTPGQAWQLPLRRAWEVQVAAALGQGMAGFLRCLRLLAQLDRAGHEGTPEPHAQLLALAVHPARRGRGLEETLLETGLARIDATGVACTTVCFQAATVLYFVDHGFRAVADGDVPQGGPHFWVVRRPAGGTSIPR